MMVRSVLVLVAIASCAIAGPAVACRVSGVNLVEVRKKSDVIATGIVRVISETEKKVDDTTETFGVIQLREPTLLKNRTGPLGGPLRFRFATLWTDDGCFFGTSPPSEGDRATVYLVRAPGSSPGLHLIYVEVLERAPDEDDSEPE